MWSSRERLLFLLAALAATAPAWPGLQPRSPIRDEMLAPGEVAVLVPVVLLFPISWALLAREKRIGRGVGSLLVCLVAGWSLGTVHLATYETPPTVDDHLHGYLIVAGLAVLIAAVVTRSVVPKAGLGVWLLGCAAAVAVPVVSGPPTSPEADLPPGITAAESRLDCHRSCTRVQTVPAAGTARARALTRQIGEHLERDGWRMRWYDFTAEPDVECRRPHRLTDPYYLCLQLRAIGDPDAKVEVRLYYGNRHDPVYKAS
ncbi:hypothetical protein BJY16_007716 [Actinoplanes octamycinicus]|uniref:Uncharacterized protein n=2 Tax=Actinoplanes octamycinicus TaxID=135948 RepID=A0A7W7MBP3_9ACTN|nr:hypothetical protein [Actinoplanes octamycinicus]MBB4744257.1 hypothetical protein [Actinoplanes octamycinicus]